MNMRFAVCSLLAASFLAGCAGPERKITPLSREESPRPAPILAPAEIEQAPPPAEVKPEPKSVVVQPVEINAGHGGPRDGAVSHDKKLKEKDLTLDSARRVQKLLEGSPWQVVMTRTNDADIGLSNRVGIAEQKKADLFISLHFNSYTNR